MEERPNTIYFHSVIDRLILKKKVLEHFLRSLAEKQALLKFYSLSNENNPALEANNFHPLIVGTHLLSSKKQNIIEERIDETTKKSWNYLLPYLLNYVEVLFQTKEDQITKYFVRACNLHAFPDQNVIQEKTGAKLATYTYDKCKTFIPVQIIRFETEEGKWTPKALTAFQYWFNLFFLSHPDEKKKQEVDPNQKQEINKILDQKPQWFPPCVFFYMLNVCLIYAKISPHVTLPYHIYTVQEKKNTNLITYMYVATELPEIVLENFASLPSDTAKNKIMHEHWERTEKKQWINCFILFGVLLLHFIFIPC